MRSTPTSATRRSAARSTAGSRRWSSELEQRRRGRDHHVQAQRRRRRPGRPSSVTGKARAAIRRATRAAVRGNMPALGRQIVERLCERASSDYSDEKLAGALPRLARASHRGRAGRGRSGRDAPSDVAAGDVSRLQGGARRQRLPPPEAERRLVRAQAAPRRSSSGCRTGRTAAAIPIRGINGDLPVRFAPTAARCRATASSAS